MEQKLFPKELLISSYEEKINYFEKYTVSHPIFEKQFSDLMDRIYNGPKNSILLVFGPAGAGKSKVIEKVREKIIKDNFDYLQTNRGIIPSLKIEAVPPDSGNFDWRDFYYRALEAANEPLIDFKVDFEGEKKKKDGSKSALRRSLESMLRHRKPFAFIVDEAQHITMTTSGRNLRNQINILKSLVNISKVPIVLTGSYDLLTYRDLNGQTIRRGEDFHISRYNTQNNTDIEAFINVLLAFQKHLPLEIEPNLIDYWDYFYSHTIGCVGILKDWFNLTFSINIKNNNNLKTLTIDDFKKHELSADKCLKLLKEAAKGEEKYKGLKQKEQQLYNELGLNMKVEEELIVSKEILTKKKKTNKNSKPGQRNPKRDSVGNNKNSLAQ